MTWFGYFVLAFWGFNALGSVWMIGKKREPMTPPAAAILVAVYALFIWGLLAVGTHS